MFSVECPTHEGTVLLGPGRITSLRHDQAGTTIGWRCTCGTVGSTFVARIGGAAVEPPAPRLAGTLDAA